MGVVPSLFACSSRHLRRKEEKADHKRLMMAKTRCVLLLFAVPLASSLRIYSGRSVQSTTCEAAASFTSRRKLISTAAVAASALMLQPNEALATGNMPAVMGEATKMDGAVKKASNPAAAKKQIAAGYEELGKLIDDFDKVSGDGGGDGIRRKLGVVGTESPLYLIEPAFRLLFESDESLPMEYIDTLEQLMRNLSSADSEAYSAIFIEFSSAKGKPADYFARSKAACIRARDDWKTLMGYLQM